jgi:tetratricopeptide (TPR) repeat protein
MVKEDHSKGRQYLHQVINISEETRDYFKLWYSNFNLGTSLSWDCQFEKGLEFYRETLRLSETANNLISIATVKSNICANNYFWRGNIDLAYQTSLDSLSTAEESGDIFAKGPACMAYGAACFGKGLFDEAANSLKDALAFSDKMNEVAWGPAGCSLLGDLYLEIGLYDKAQYYFQKGISIMDNARIIPSFSIFSSLHLALAKVLNGDTDINVAELYDLYSRNNLKVFEGWDARCICHILLKIDYHDLSEAAEWLHKAVEADTKNGMFWHLGRDHALWADLFKRKEDSSKAAENLTKAIDIMEECGADGWAQKYTEERTALS